jgi:hypothetical protein
VQSNATPMDLPEREKGERTKPSWMECKDNAIITHEDNGILNFLYEVVDTTSLCEAVAPSPAFAPPIDNVSVMANSYEFQRQERRLV